MDDIFAAIYRQNCTYLEAAKMNDMERGFMFLTACEVVLLVAGTIAGPVLHWAAAAAVLAGLTLAGLAVLFVTGACVVIDGLRTP